MNMFWQGRVDKKKGCELMAECPICMDILSEEDLGALNNCGHVFHCNCLKQWIGTQRRDGYTPSCPICKVNCSSLDPLRLYVSSRDSDELQRKHQSKLEHKVKDLESKLYSLVYDVSEKDEVIRKMSLQLKQAEMILSVTNAETEQLLSKVRQLELWKYRQLGMLDEVYEEPENVINQNSSTPETSLHEISKTQELYPLARLRHFLWRAFPAFMSFSSRRQSH